MSGLTKGPWHLVQETDPTQGDGSLMHSVRGVDGSTVVDNQAYYPEPVSLEDAQWMVAAWGVLDAARRVLAVLDAQAGTSVFAWKTCACGKRFESQGETSCNRCLLRTAIEACLDPSERPRMTLAEALALITPVRGQSSIIGALLSGDTSSITGKEWVNETLDEAYARLEAVTKAQETCGSEHAHWGYEGDKSYWKTVCSLLRAAELCGANNLPLVTYEHGNRVVMDECYYQEKWGIEVLRLAKQEQGVES